MTTREELERCFAIRMAVFVDEQHVEAANEIDALDFAPPTRHVLAEVGGHDAGTARLLIDEAGQCTWAAWRSILGPAAPGWAVR